MAASSPDPDQARAPRALAATSVFIAIEQRRIHRDRPPERLAVSVVTIGELRLGVLTATTGAQRDQRLETLTAAERLEPLSIDRQVAHAWSSLRLALRDAGRRMPLNDSWVAATAIAQRIPVVTQDDDYAEVPGLSVLRI
jgi:predicted nucleic acid-binding protein